MPVRAKVMMLIALSAILAGVLAWRWLAPVGTGGQPLATTECPFVGPPVIALSQALDARDTLPVRLHEDAHAAQCRTLGPWRYRLRNLSASGRLSLEAEGYCAGARGRIAQGEDPRRVRERLIDDATAAFHGQLGAAEVMAALLVSCRDLAQ